MERTSPPGVEPDVHKVRVLAIRLSRLNEVYWDWINNEVSKACYNVKLDFGEIPYPRRMTNEV